jgi:hypothetical protein
MEQSRTMFREAVVDLIDGLAPTSRTFFGTGSTTTTTEVEDTQRSEVRRDAEGEVGEEARARAIDFESEVGGIVEGVDERRRGETTGSGRPMRLQEQRGTNAGVAQEAIEALQLRVIHGRGKTLAGRGAQTVHAERIAPVEPLVSELHSFHLSRYFPLEVRIDHPFGRSFLASRKM